MARVTVEDCIAVVENRFELVALASKRAKDIGSGAPINVSRDNDKNPVVALREIAERRVNIDALHRSFIQGLQKRIKSNFDTIEESEEVGKEKVESPTELNEEIKKEIESLTVGSNEDNKEVSFGGDDIEADD